MANPNRQRALWIAVQCVVAIHVLCIGTFGQVPDRVGRADEEKGDTAVPNRLFVAQIHIGSQSLMVWPRSPSYSLKDARGFVYQTPAIIDESIEAIAARAVKDEVLNFTIKMPRLPESIAKTAKQEVLNYYRDFNDVQWTTEQIDLQQDRLQRYEVVVKFPGIEESVVVREEDLGDGGIPGFVHIAHKLKPEQVEALKEYPSLLEVRFNGVHEFTETDHASVEISLREELRNRLIEELSSAKAAALDHESMQELRAAMAEHIRVIIRKSSNRELNNALDDLISLALGVLSKRRERRELEQLYGDTERLFVYLPSIGRREIEPEEFSILINSLKNSEELKTKLVDNRKQLKAIAAGSNTDQTFYSNTREWCRIHGKGGADVDLLGILSFGGNAAGDYEKEYQDLTSAQKSAVKSFRQTLRQESTTEAEKAIEQQLEIAGEILHKYTVPRNYLFERLTETDLHLVAYALHQVIIPGKKGTKEYSTLAIDSGEVQTSTLREILPTYYIPGDLQVQGDIRGGGQLRARQYHVVVHDSEGADEANKESLNKWIGELRTEFGEANVIVKPYHFTSSNDLVEVPLGKVDGRHVASFISWDNVGKGPFPGKDDAFIAHGAPSKAQLHLKKDGSLTCWAPSGKQAAYVRVTVLYTEHL